MLRVTMCHSVTVAPHFWTDTFSPIISKSILTLGSHNLDSVFQVGPNYNYEAFFLNFFFMLLPLTVL